MQLPVAERSAVSRRVVFLAVILLSTVAFATPAAAAGDWDPDDVEGPLDLRWVGGSFTAAGNLRLTVSFYDGFTPSVLPTQQDLVPFQASS